MFGLSLTLFSIWFTWWLAKRDLQKRLSVAEERGRRRIQLILLRADLSRIYWLLREARGAYQSHDLDRVFDRCEWVEYFLTQLRAEGILKPDESALVQTAEDDIRLVVKAVRKQAGGSTRKKEVSERQTERLSGVLKRLATLEGYLEARIGENVK